MKDGWTEFIPAHQSTWPLPFNAVGKQADVEFYGKSWSWAMVGMVTHTGDGFEWSVYDQQNDKYLIWEDQPDYYRHRTLPTDA